jgi:hypothetical protein
LISAILTPNEPRKRDLHLGFRQTQNAVRILFEEKNIHSVMPNKPADIDFDYLILLREVLVQLDRLILRKTVPEGGPLDTTLFRDDMQYRQDQLEEVFRLAVENNPNLNDQWLGMDPDTRFAFFLFIHDIFDDYYPTDTINALATQHDATVFTPHSIVTSVGAIDPRDLRTSDILPILAMSGLDIAMPNITSDDPNAIEEIRISLKDEREAYLISMQRLVADCFSALNAGDYKDIAQYVDIKLKNDLHIRLDEYRRKVEGKNKKFIKDHAITVLEETPSLFGNFASGNIVGGIEKSLQIVTGLITGALKRSDFKNDYPDVSFLYGLKTEMTSA